MGKVISGTKYVGLYIRVKVVIDFLSNIKVIVLNHNFESRKITAPKLALYMWLSSTFYPAFAISSY